MKKGVSWLFLVLAALAAAFIMSGCDANNPVIDEWWTGTPAPADDHYVFTPGAYVVSFDSDGGTYVDLINGGTTDAPPQRVLANAKATVPGLVVKAGNWFSGWYTEAAGINKWDFNTPVTSDMTLYAEWNGAGGYTVHFEPNFPAGSGLAARDLVYTPQDEKIAGGASAAEPLQFGLKEESPYSGDYVFSGWYTDDDAGALYDFSTPVTGNITLYARWAKMGTGKDEKPPLDVFAVTFVSNTGSTPPDQYILRGSAIVNPFVVFKSGYYFGGWYTTPDFSGKEWDFTRPVEDAYTTTARDGQGRNIVTLYAEWEQVDEVDIFKDLDVKYFNYVLFAGGSVTYNEISSGSNASTLSEGDVTANNKVIAAVRQLLQNNPTYRVMVIGHANPTTQGDRDNPKNPGLLQISDGRVAAVKAQLDGIPGYNTAETPVLTRSEGGEQALQDPALSRRGEIVVFDVTNETITP